MNAEQRSRCELCERLVREVTDHHLIPRSEHQRVVKRKNAALQELRENTIDLCLPCHRMVHRLLTEKELASTWNSMERLRQHPGLARFVQWVRKQPDRPITVR